jgi:Protein of unknown function (DUF3040)
MTMHDPSARTSRGVSRRVRWFGLRHGLGMSGRTPPYPAPPIMARSQPGSGVRGRYPRRLAAIERALVADTPELSSKFVLFNRLTAGEPPAGVEQVPRAARSRPRSAYLAVLLALAAITALCVTLSLQMRPAARPCVVTAAAPASAGAHAPVHGGDCHAYATNK